MRAGGGRVGGEGAAGARGIRRVHVRDARVVLGVDVVDLDRLPPAHRSAQRKPHVSNSGDNGLRGAAEGGGAQLQRHTRLDRDVGGRAQLPIGAHAGHQLEQCALGLHGHVVDLEARGLGCGCLA